jgi:DNA-cytosine methyltransferase
MNVLSLFDGMSCGQLALNRAGIKYDKYFASEVDKYAIAVTQHNFPDTIQLGGVLQVQAKDLPKIDLLIGGSPCQGFSFAGKQLNFDDPRSKLFFEFVRLLKECRPKYFMLENVKMKKEYQDVISKYLNVEPIEINSALVSAQNRKRLYWTNIPNITQPEDKGILLKDILEQQVESDYNLSETMNKRISSNKRSRGILPNQDKSGALLSNQYKTSTDSLYVIVDDLYKSRKERVYKEKSCTLRHNCGQLKVKSKCIQIGEADIKGMDVIKRVYSPEGKAPTLSTMQGGHREPKISEDNITWRKLTPIECERLQTVPDNYTLVPHPVYKGKPMSNSQRYKMLGNGWTVDVVAHIFKNIT